MPTDTSADHDIFARRESTARSYCRNFPARFTTARGSILTDENGRDYIDFLAGCSSLNYGHNDPDMKAALIEHLSRDGLAHGLDLFTDAKAAFLETFERIILRPRALDHKVMMTGPTGTNAVEAAIKLARKVTGRRNIIAFTNAFHGMSLGALALTGNSSKREGAGGVGLADVTHLPFENALDGRNTLEYIEWMLDNPSSGLDDPAAFIVEPVQGEGGLNAASGAWLRGIERLARKHGALFIIDDIQAGIGRTGPWFSFEGMGLDPDLITQAKSFGGMGLPFAALLIKPPHDIWKPAEHNGTFRGNTHAFVTARVAMEKFWSDDRFENEVLRKSALLRARLADIAARIPRATLKGRGMMQGIDTGNGDLAADICARAFEDGLIIETSGAWGEVVKVLAPLTTPDDILNRGLDILDSAVAAATVPTPIAAE